MLDFELAAAKACVAYHREVAVRDGLTEGRDRLGTCLRDLYVRRLRLPDAAVRVDATRAALENPNTVLVEMAHDGQLPHLGIVRLVLKARQIAAAAGRGMAMYLVGDHYTAEMRPENLYVGLPLRGADTDHVKNPLTVPVGRKARHIPFRWLPPPSAESIDDLERRSEAWSVNNAAYAGRRSAIPEVHERIRHHFDLLRTSAAATTSFGDWLMRVQVLWLEELFGGPPSHLAVLPMSGITEWASDRLGQLLNPRESAEGLFWIYCPSCYRRYRPRRSGEQFAADCGSCKKTVFASWPRDADRFMPDIVAFEMALFGLGIAGWVVGSRAAYHPAIEAEYRARFRREMPPKFFVTSIPRFVGLGEPPSGHPRARLLRVLLEMDPLDVRRALEARWEDDPVLRSPLLDAKALDALG